MAAVQSLRKRIGHAVYTAREVLALPGTRRAALHDVGHRTTHVADERHLAAAIQWLCRAQDACSDGGVSYGYSVRRGWMAAYPETTGYIIPTLFDYAANLDRDGRGRGDGLRQRATHLARWLIGVQLESGAIPGGTVLQVPQPTVFNTGQVLDGWCRVFRETGDRQIREAITRAATWLTNTQDEDGCWRRGRSPLTPNTPAVYNVRTASVLLRASELLNEPRWERAALKNGDWVLTQQRPNGWFENNCVLDNDNPLTHTIGYTLEGLLELAARSHADRYLEAVMRATEALLPNIDEEGFMSGQFDAEWRPAAPWSCLTGECQLAMVWFRLSSLTGDGRYKAAGQRLLDFVKSTQRISAGDGGDVNVLGGIKGSHPIWGRYEPFAYPNWATKFFADALLASPRIEVSPSTYARWTRLPVATSAGLRVAYVVEDYPTFIVSEIAQLRQLGAHVTVLSAFRPQPEADVMKDAARRESVYLPSSFLRVVWDNASALARRPIAYVSTFAALIGRREAMRFLVLGACHATVIRRNRVHHVHGTFGTRTTTLAYVISRLCGIPFSFTTHAYDVFRHNHSLAWKTNEAAFMRTISRFNRSFIGRAYPGLDLSRVKVIYLGVDSSAIRPSRIRHRDRPLRILAVGSLIEQKGYLVLIRSCAQLAQRGVRFECRIVGEGPLRSRLEEEIRQFGLGAHVKLLGELPHMRAMDELEKADIFTLPCIDMRGRGGHVDGIPVVLMEAMAAGVPVISTRLSGIPELIESGRTGLLVTPENPDELAAAISQLAADRRLRETIAATARRKIEDEFDLARNASMLAAQMRNLAAVPAVVANACATDA